MPYVIAYDIVSPQSRRRLVKLLQKSNCKRVQKSVFYFEGSREQMERILPPLNALLTPEDSLLCWRVGKSAPQGRYPNLSHCEQAIAAIVFDGEILQVSTSSSNSGDLDSDD